MSRFLARVERRAFKHALYAMNDEHQALDVVQDAMIKLAEKYGGKPAAELPLLFQRILQNTIRDHCRRRKVRNAWTALFSSLAPKDGNDDFDLLDSLKSEEQAAHTTPDSSLQQSQIIRFVERELSRLPGRQREAFLLRYWEGLDISETAAAMGCSEGSVKTHCSRAVHALAATLKKNGIELP